MLEDSRDASDEIEEIKRLREDRQNELRQVIHEIKAGKVDNIEQAVEVLSNSTPRNCKLICLY